MFLFGRRSLNLGIVKPICFRVSNIHPKSSGYLTFSNYTDTDRQEAMIDNLQTEEQKGKQRNLISTKI